MATSKKKNTGFDPDEAPVKGGREQRPRPEDLVDMVVLPKGKTGAAAYKAMRFHGKVFVTGQHWVRTKKRDGSFGSFPAPCANFDPSTGARDHDGKCPWCKAEERFRPKSKGDKTEQAPVRFAVDYWLEGIDRAEQARMPSRLPRITAEEKATGFKESGSESWTANRVLRLSGNDLKRMRTLKELNLVKKGGESTSFSIFDPKYGCDVNIKYDGEEKVPANRWTFARVDRQPLTEEENAMLKQDMSKLINDEIDVVHEAAEVESWARRMGLVKPEEGDDGDDEDDEDSPKSKRRSSKEVTKDLAKKARAAVKDLDDDDEEEDEDEEEDDEPPAKKGKKPAPAKKGKKVVDDEDDEDEDEEDEDEEDEPPPKKSSKKPAPSKKPAKKVVEDDDDEEDEDEEEDEEDEPPPKKGAKKPAPNKKPVDDEDDEDEDEEDEDEEDEPPPKKSSKKPAPPAKKGKKVVEDDDDEEDEDEDEEDEDDEEDEPPPKKSKKPVPPPPPKGKKGKRVADDDDDIPF